MKQLKKRTLALVLASVVTVVGAFASENYKNSILNLSFETTSNGINMNVETKYPYNGNVTPTKKDSTTYILMLPEINSNAKTPNLNTVSGNIKSVSVKTMPYTNNAKGYTKITIKTLHPNVLVSGQNKLFIETEKTQHENYSETTLEQNSYKESYENKNEYKSEYTYESNEASESSGTDETENSSQYYEEQESSTINTNSYTENSSYEVTDSIINKQNSQEEEYTEATTSLEKTSTIPSYLWLFVLLISLCSIYFYSKAKNKMTEITGETFNITLEEKENKKNKKQNNNRIKNKTKNVSEIYNKPSEVFNNNIQQNQNIEKETNVLDLDKLFKEKQAQSSKESDENLALEDFLSGFSFMEEELNLNTYNEEFYKKVINNKKLKFSVTEINCIYELLSNEISDEILNLVDQKRHVLKEKKTKQIANRLEDFVTTYSISQNIKFKKEDIEALDKIMHAELDPDFITDLRTSSERTKQMEKEILAFNEKLKKPSEIITMKVKNFLPDLSEALKKIGNKKIESNYKPDAVYYSEGYDVSILSVNEQLPDLSSEIEKEDAYETKTSYNEIEYIDPKFNSDVPKLKISDPINLTEEKENTKEKPRSLQKESRPKTNNAQNLIQQINNTKNLKKPEIVSNNKKEEAKPVENVKIIEKGQKTQCVIDNEPFIIVNSSKIKDNIGFHLAKNNSGYTILGFIDDNLIKLKSYSDLKSELIQARLSQKINDELFLYIVKVGTVKFIAEVSDKNIRHVMDL